jgi:hypothetical protein
MEQRRWIKARRSSAQGNCLELRRTPDGGVELRNSRHPDQVLPALTRAELAAFLDGAKGGEFDHLTR